MNLCPAGFPSGEAFRLQGQGGADAPDGTHAWSENCDFLITNVRSRARCEVRRRALTRSPDQVHRASAASHRIDDTTLLHRHLDWIDDSWILTLPRHRLKHLSRIAL